MLSWITDLKIAVKIGATLAVIVISAVIVSILSLNNLSKIENTNYWTEHTYKVMGEISLLTGAMVDQETGVRGYLISGDTGFLAPYVSGQKAFAAALANARQFTSDNPRQQERLTAVEGLARQWRTGVAEKEIALMGTPSTQEEARRLEASGAGKAAMDALRAKAAEIVAEEASLLGERSATAMAAGTASRLANWGVLGTIVLVSVVGLLLLHVGIARPITGMTTMMGRLAQGDVSLTVPGAGRRDEVGAMAAAVGVFKDTMIRTRQLEKETELARADAEAHRKAAMREMADTFEAAVGGIIGHVSLVGHAAAGDGTDHDRDGERDRRPVQCRRRGGRRGRGQRQHGVRGRGGARGLGPGDQPPGAGFGEPGASRHERSRRYGAARAGPEPGSGQDRRCGRPDLQHRRSDEPSRAECDDRGGACRGSGTRLCRGRHGGQGTGEPDGTGDPGDRRADRADPDGHGSRGHGDRRDHRAHPRHQRHGPRPSRRPSRSRVPPPRRSSATWPRPRLARAT